MRSARYLKAITKLGLTAVAFGILAGAGSAVTVYQGKFTLPIEVRWGSSTLPAGEYTFEMVSQASPYRIYIHGQKANAIIQAISADTEVLSTTAQLDIVDLSDVPTIKTFEAPELGVTFTYFTPKQKPWRLKRFVTRACHKRSLRPRSALAQCLSRFILQVAEETSCKLLQTPGAGIQRLNRWRRTLCRSGAASTGGCDPLRDPPPRSLRRPFLPATTII